MSSQSTLIKRMLFYPKRNVHDPFRSLLSGCQSDSEHSLSVFPKLLEYEFKRIL